MAEDSRLDDTNEALQRGLAAIRDAERVPPVEPQTDYRLPHQTVIALLGLALELSLRIDVTDELAAAVLKLYAPLALAIAPTTYADRTEIATARDAARRLLDTLSSHPSGSPTTPKGAETDDHDPPR